MAAGNLTINVRVRVGPLGKLAIALARRLPRVVPLRLVVWCVHRSSYLSANGGPWHRFRPDLTDGGGQ